MKDKICYVLKELSVAPHLLGFEYLVDAIEIVCYNHSVLHAITKQLYPTIAKRHGTTGKRVERAIRHAIEISFEYSAADTVKSVFGNTIKASSGRVTNTQFIATLVEVLENEPNHPIFDGSIFEGAGRHHI